MDRKAEKDQGILRVSRLRLEVMGSDGGGGKAGRGKSAQLTFAERVMEGSADDLIEKATRLSSFAREEGWETQNIGYGRGREDDFGRGRKDSESGERTTGYCWRYIFANKERDGEDRREDLLLEAARVLMRWAESEGLEGAVLSLKDPGADSKDSDWGEAVSRKRGAEEALRIGEAAGAGKARGPRGKGL